VGVAMTLQEIINTCIAAAFATIGWFVRTMYDSVTNIKQDIDDHKLHVSETYVKKSEVDTLRTDMDKRFDRLEQMIARLYDKIDSKADK
jgi:hypothetical protein